MAVRSVDEHVAAVVDVGVQVGGQHVAVEFQVLVGTVARTAMLSKFGTRRGGAGVAPPRPGRC